jgi:hypothetical protein
VRLPAGPPAADDPLVAPGDAFELAELTQNFPRLEVQRLRRFGRSQSMAMVTVTVFSVTPVLEILIYQDMIRA